MKKLFLPFILLLGTVGVTQAQKIETKPQTSADVGMRPIQTGNWMVGGSIGSLGYSFEGKSFNAALNPRAGYFVSDGIAIGAEGMLGLTTIKDGKNDWRYGIAPFVRYYFPEGASSTGRFFGQGSVGIAGSSLGDGATFTAGANLGYAHFITQTVALEATFGYNYSKANVSGADKSTGLGVGVGFQIYLPGKR
ncbi:Uncharacterised protein [Sphingobacterium spiritivorum]|uniref:Outer membrane protein beta-barrel domain-containing protein n=1 Tax=Sphingobacterium spiritivorum TaxID=258 RepID=A0A380C9Z0_SPHSI|nr:hypothetical protein [Sphingobacterium spiritivorum]SUJ16397.1 Uncharacterised protein [Sphingobacterium spiritivorum]